MHIISRLSSFPSIFLFFIHVAFATEVVSLSWVAQEGAEYELQSCDNLEAGSWVNTGIHFHGMENEPMSVQIRPATGDVLDGLHCERWLNPAQNGLAALRRASQNGPLANPDWTGWLPAGTIPNYPAPSALRLSGKVLIPVSGQYQFSFAAAGQADLRVGGFLVASTLDPIVQPSYTYKKGDEVEIEVLQWRNAGPASITLKWAGPWGGEIPIDGSQFSAASSTADGKQEVPSMMYRLASDRLGAQIADQSAIKLTGSNVRVPSRIPIVLVNIEELETCAFENEVSRAEFRVNLEQNSQIVPYYITVNLGFFGENHPLRGSASLEDVAFRAWDGDSLPLPVLVNTNSISVTVPMTNPYFQLGVEGLQDGLDEVPEGFQLSILPGPYYQIGGITTPGSSADYTLFVDQDFPVGVTDSESYEGEPVLAFTDPGSSVTATITNAFVEVYFRVDGASCEHDIELQLTDPAGNLVLTSSPFASCDGPGNLFYKKIVIPSATFTGEPADWTLAFRDTEDQNTGQPEYSVRFARISYTAVVAPEPPENVAYGRVKDARDAPEHARFFYADFSNCAGGNPVGSAQASIRLDGPNETLAIEIQTENLPNGSSAVEAVLKTPLGIVHRYPNPVGNPELWPISWGGEGASQTNQQILDALLNNELRIELAFNTGPQLCAQLVENSAPNRMQIFPVATPRPADDWGLDMPTTVGLVFERGQLDSTLNWRVLRADNSIVPSEYEVTGWWDEAQTMIKWLVLRFPANELDSYFFEFDVAPAPFEGDNLVVNQGTTITVQTDALRVELDPAQTCLFASVLIDGAERVTCNGPGFVLTSDDNVEATLSGWTLSVEHNSPFRAVVRGQGFFDRPDGERVAALDVRMTFYADESTIDLSHTVTWMLSDPARGANEWALRINPLIEGTPSVRFSEGEAIEVVAGASISAFQSASDHYDIRQGNTALFEGTRMGGWIAVENSSGKGVGVSLRHAWQTHPTTLAYDQDGMIRIGMWPREAPSMAFEPTDLMPADYYYGSNYSWNAHTFVMGQGHFVHEYGHVPGFQHTPEGAARTHELRIHFYDTESARTIEEVDSYNQQPVVHRQDPVEALKVPVYGLDLVPTGDMPADMEASLEQLGVMAFSRWDAHHDYGFWRFGFTRWGSPGQGLKRWFDGGQYDLQLLPWMLYLRGGDRRWYDEGLISGRWHMDVATNHHNTRGAPTGYQSSAAGMPFPTLTTDLGKGAKRHFLTYFHRMTGDRRAGEVLDEVVEGKITQAITATQGWIGDPTNPGYRHRGRELYNMLGFWSGGVADDHRSELLPLQQQYLTLALGREYDPTLKNFRSPGIYLYEGLVQAHQLWEQQDWGVLDWDPVWTARRSANSSWTANDMRDLMLEHLGALGYPDGPGAYDTTHAFALPWAYQQTGDERYARYGWDIARGLADIIPQGQLNNQQPEFFSPGNTIMRQFVLPLLANGSLGAKLGYTVAEPYVRSDAFIGPGQASAPSDDYYARARNNGPLELSITVTRGQNSPPPPDIHVEVFDAAGILVGQGTIEEFIHPNPFPNRFQPHGIFERSVQITVPAATEGQIFRIAVYDENDIYMRALVTGDADMVVVLPPNEMIEFSSRAGQHDAGARFFARTNAEIISVVANQHRPYTIRDAQTGAVLARSSFVSNHVSVPYTLGANRDIVITVKGGVDHLMKFVGLSPYVSPQDGVWYQP